MSNLKTWLIQRRSKFYDGEPLQKMVDDFLEMVNGGAVVHEFKDAIIVLEDYGLPGNARGWLLFDKFKKGTVSAMKKVTDSYQGNLYASTHDVRIKDLLVRLGYQEYSRDSHDYYLVRRANHGM